jgi:hypothetical protein
MALDFFSEFNGIVRGLQRGKVRYAVIGGFAVVLYGGLRSTKDIDFMVHPDDLDRFRVLLKSLGYISNRQSLTFKNSGLTLHRFLKFERGESSYYIVDVLVADTDANQSMLKKAGREKWGGGIVRVVRRKDLIDLKKQRSSHLDLADIEVLKKRKSHAGKNVQG